MHGGDLHGTPGQTESDVTRIEAPTPPPGANRGRPKPPLRPTSVPPPPPRDGAASPVESEEPSPTQSAVLVTCEHPSDEHQLAESESSTPKHGVVADPTIVTSAISDAVLANRIETLISKRVSCELIEGIIARRLGESDVRALIDETISSAVSRISVAQTAANDIVTHVLGTPRQTVECRVEEKPVSTGVTQAAFQNISDIVDSQQHTLMYLRPLRERVTKMDQTLQEMNVKFHGFRTEIAEKMSNTRGHVKALKFGLAEASTSADRMKERVERHDSALDELRQQLPIVVDSRQQADLRAVAESSVAQASVRSEQDESLQARVQNLHEKLEALTSRQLQSAANASEPEDCKPEIHRIAEQIRCATDKLEPLHDRMSVVEKCVAQAKNTTSFEQAKERLEQQELSLEELRQRLQSVISANELAECKSDLQRQVDQSRASLEKLQALHDRVAVVETAVAQGNAGNAQDGESVRAELKSLRDRLEAPSDAEKMRMSLERQEVALEDLRQQLQSATSAIKQVDCKTELQCQVDQMRVALEKLEPLHDRMLVVETSVAQDTAGSRQDSESLRAEVKSLHEKLASATSAEQIKALFDRQEAALTELRQRLQSAASASEQAECKTELERQADQMRAALEKLEPLHDRVVVVESSVAHANGQSRENCDILRAEVTSLRDKLDTTTSAEQMKESLQRQEVALENLRQQLQSAAVALQQLEPLHDRMVAVETSVAQVNDRPWQDDKSSLEKPEAETSAEQLKKSFDEQVVALEDLRQRLQSVASAGELAQCNIEQKRQVEQTRLTLEKLESLRDRMVAVETSVAEASAQFRQLGGMQSEVKSLEKKLEATSSAVERQEVALEEILQRLQSAASASEQAECKSEIQRQADQVRVASEKLEPLHDRVVLVETSVAQAASTTRHIEESLHAEVNVLHEKFKASHADHASLVQKVEARLEEVAIPQQLQPIHDRVAAIDASLRSLDALRPLKDTVDDHSRRLAEQGSVISLLQPLQNNVERTLQLLEPLEGRVRCIEEDAISRSQPEHIQAIVDKCFAERHDALEERLQRQQEEQQAVVDKCVAERHSELEGLLHSKQREEQAKVEGRAITRYTELEERLRRQEELPTAQDAVDPRALRKLLERLEAAELAAKSTDENQVRAVVEGVLAESYISAEAFKPLVEQVSAMERCQKETDVTLNGRLDHAVDAEAVKTIVRTELQEHATRVESTWVQPLREQMAQTQRKVHQRGPSEVSVRFSIENVNLSRMNAQQKTSLEVAVARRLADAAGIDPIRVRVALAGGSVKVDARVEKPVGASSSVGGLVAEELYTVLEGIAGRRGVAAIVDDVGRMPGIAAAMDSPERRVTVTEPKVSIELVDEPVAAEVQRHLEKMVERHVTTLGKELQNTAAIGSTSEGGETVHSVSDVHPLTRPPTSPRPFASDHLSFGSQPVQKANWTSNSYYTVATTPNRDDSRPAMLMHASLEHDLVAKVLAREPERARGPTAAATDIAIRGMANSVVREIVGIFEQLLDRMLMEKKHDTIRCMVAELMNEDVAKTISAAHDQLRRKEMGHLSTELERLRAEMRESEVMWEDRFTVAQELRDSQDELWTTFDERCRSLDGRLVDLEAISARRPEVDEHVTNLAAELDSSRQHITRVEAELTERSAQLTDLRIFCRDTYALKTDLSSANDRFVDDVRRTREELRAGLGELREYAAPRAAHDELKVMHEDAKRATNTAIFNTQQTVDMVSVQLQKTTRSADETFATKLEQEKEGNRINAEIEQLMTMLNSSIGNVEEKSATKFALEESNGTLQRRLRDIEVTLHNTVSSVDKTTFDLRSLEFQQKSLATREYCFDTAHTLAHQVSEKCTEKEDIAQLRREFEEERERLRQTIRQHQLCRKDLNESIEMVHEIRLRATDLQNSSERTREHLERLDGREVKDWQWTQIAMKGQKQAHEELDAFYKSLRDQFLSHVNHVRNESEQLKDHTTHRYLEQMDKALSLQEKLDKIETEHGTMSETVRHIRLPKVS
eukprot:TRINITY_DN11722_c0_g1_i1.p1 TRINITY_DN11722_c0_g1~~TRINITY_DN11722_c0_g1_i1.p1  ORF type:complete len:2013 (-),score=447.98 TRINITY_DN11722_c0_g1_i1:25-6063(-)